MDISEQCNYYIQVPMYRIISVAFYVFANANSLFSSEISIPQNNSDSRKPVIIEAPTDLITTESILEFTCKAKGSPNPLIVWYNASTGRPLVDKLQTIGYQTSVHVNKHLGQLMISNPTPGKSYRVYCNATNSAGWMISEPPATGAIAFLNSEFRLHPSDIEADEGTSVTLECLPPIGLPKPKYLG
ncbi:unnamed protein product [Heterobilharzia americana]|nr:unnamed protein product [Heterobilharzia americana]